MRTSKHFVSQHWRTMVVLFVLFLATAAFCQLTPSDDAYVDTTKPATNFGAAVTLGVVSPSQATYITFDLSSIPSGYTGGSVAKASLKLYVNTVTTAGSFNVDYVNGAWAEKTINANNAPPPGAAIAASIPLAKTQAKDYVIIDVTSAVKAWLNGTETNYGIALVANSPLSATLDSKENAAQSHPPELDVVFTGGGGITGVLTGAGSGLTGGGTSGTLNLSLLTSCTNGQVLAWNSSSGWVCTGLSGGGTITGVLAGTDLTGGGKSGTVTLNLDTTKVPQLNVSNTFTGNQTVNGNVGATGAISGAGFLIGSDLFAFGSKAINNAFLGFSGNTTMTGGQNTSLGAGALLSDTTGSWNTAIGHNAMLLNTTGARNIAVGEGAVSGNIAANDNTGVGAAALFNTTAGGNTAIGSLALYSDNTGSQNTVTGYNAMPANTTGSDNSAGGAGAMYLNTTGGQNTATGKEALWANTTGSYNTANGRSALYNNQTGNYNTALGWGAGPDPASTNLTNATAIGAAAQVSASNSMVLGSINGINNATSNVSVGIGTTKPVSSLHVLTAGTVPYGAVSAKDAIGGECGASGCTAVEGITTAAPGYGVYALATGSSGVALYAATGGSATQAGYFYGNVTVSGCLTAGGTQLGGGCPSDARLKTNIRPFAPSLDKVAELQPVRFNWRAENPAGYRFGPNDAATGLIAQQVEQVFPEMVSTDKNGYKRVNYGLLPIMLLEGVRELKARNDSLSSQVHQQQSQIAALNRQVVQLQEAQQAQIARLSSQIKAIQASLNANSQAGYKVHKVKTQAPLLRE